MKHKNDQAMLFYFLDRNYDKSLKEVEEEISLCFGDFRFQKLTLDEIMPIARVMWAFLHGKSLREEI